MNDQLSSRISSLLQTAKDDFSKSNLHILVKDEECQAFAKLAFKTYSENVDDPEVLRKSQFLSAFAAEIPARVNRGELIVGSQAFGLRRAWLPCLTDQQREIMMFNGNNGHIIVDYGKVLGVGIEGLVNRVDKIHPETQQQMQNQEAFRIALEAFSLFIEKHGRTALAQAEQCQDPDRKEELKQIADNCRWICRQPPRSFWEALQLTWFIQVLLHAEGGAAAVSFGRFDLYLGDYLEKDLADGLINMQLAEELLSCFWLKTCEGDESQNLIVGGTDQHGNNAENLLSLLCLKVAAKLQVWQPSTSVRIRFDSSDEFWQASLDLVSSGTGQPSFFNDPVVTKSMEVLDIPVQHARNWGIVGCYEATPQGNTYGCTVNGTLVLPEIFFEYIVQDALPVTFTQFYEEFCDFLREKYETVCLENSRNFQEYARICQCSPFESACLTGCLKSGLTAEENGSDFNLLGMNILGIGTLIDSVYAVKKLVYEQKELTPQQIIEQLQQDFPNPSILCQCRELPGKYGSDSDETNSLAADLSDKITSMIINSRLENGVRPYPAFFKFSADIFASVPATPDGRKAEDKLSYGAGPGIWCKESDITSIMNSVAHITHDRCGCGSPLIISLSRKDLECSSGIGKVRQLTETFFRKGAFQIQYNVVDAESLKQARQNPQQHRELTVRISGYSARFVSIHPRWQDAIIERTEKSM